MASNFGVFRTCATAGLAARGACRGLHASVTAQARLRPGRAGRLSSEPATAPSRAAVREGKRAAAAVAMPAKSADAPLSQSLRELVTPQRSMRIDNVLGQHAYCARRHARQFCRYNDVEERREDGGVTRIMTGGVKVDPTRVFVNGEHVERAGVQLHLALWKPVGHVCTHADEEGDTVYQLLPDEFGFRKPVLSSVGRLDKMASGLLLLTQSGSLIERLTNPRRGCLKDYTVQLQAPLSATGSEAAAFASGRLELVDGHVCLPASLVPHKGLPNVARVTLQEGKYHQLRRMFAAVGHTVTAIHRTSFAGLHLKQLGLSKPGDWRQLTTDEVEVLLRGSEKQAEAAGASAPARGLTDAGRPKRVSVGVAATAPLERRGARAATRSGDDENGDGYSDVDVESSDNDAAAVLPRRAAWRRRPIGV
jgi:16S rRNA pseudouridine516 synthase